MHSNHKIDEMKGTDIDTAVSKLSLSQIQQQTGVQFGTSGVRGLVSEMTPAVCKAYTLAFLASLPAPDSQQAIAIGIDLRPSSPQIALACVAAIIEAGYRADYCGPLPTPALALYAKNCGIAAIMVTGSHIPFDRNGIKFYTASGEISKSDEANISAAQITLKTSDMPASLPAPNPAALQQYLHRYLQIFPRQVLAGMRIGVYEHSSVARDCLRTALTALGAEVISIERTEHFVPIDTEAVSEDDHRKAIAWSKQYQLDSIVTTDGDGDRPLISDEQGHWLRGDIVGLLTARFLEADTVVTPISSNTAIEQSGLFKRVIRTRIGSPYVIEAMQQAAVAGSQAVVGFEANGGFMVGESLVLNQQTLTALPTRDSLLPIIGVLAMANSQRQPVSALTAPLPQRFTASNRLQDFAKDRSTALMAELSTVAAAEQQLATARLGAITKLDTTDGIRFSFANGDIIHLRSSGNAPELRCYAEAQTPDRAAELVSSTLDIISRRD